MAQNLNTQGDTTMIMPLVMAALVSAGGHPGFPCYPAAKRPAPAVQRANHPPTVRCIPENSVMAPGDQLDLRAEASDPDGDHLSFEWSSRTGRLEARGNLARFVLEEPVAGPIVVRADDGRGGSAEATCSVRPQAPLHRIEKFSCVSHGFPRNLARLNNVDKACLDDIALRLRQDPRSRVVITGHADSGEVNALALGLQRAQHAQQYLTQERGIEAARIETASAGAQQQLDFGTNMTSRARNRRVEVLFIPYAP